LAVGAGGIVGTITTDGHIGEIFTSNLLAWNLTETGNGGATLNLVNGSSVKAVSNNSGSSNPNLGTPDLTATANHLYFNFSATDGGYFGFQNGSFGSGATFVSFGAFAANNVSQGVEIVPEFGASSSTIVEPESGNQIIASAAPDLTGTTPLLGLGLGALAAFGRRLRK